jgi:hypothetical protein
MPGPRYSISERERPRHPVRKYWWLAPVLAAVSLIGWLATGPRWFGPRVLPRATAPIQGYLGAAQTLEEEYLKFQGKRLRDDDLVRRFQSATERMSHQDFETAAQILERVAQDAALPVVFNNLGVLYAQLNERPRAVNAFREALARDLDYQPVRLNLARMGAIAGGAAELLTREVEPNNSPPLANRIAPDKPVEGTIAANTNDVDYFRVTTPPAPRDLLQVVVEPRSPGLMPALRILDSDHRQIGLTVRARDAGAALDYIFAPPPNTTYYLEISGARDSTGDYLLKVLPQHAFDRYEPNDDIFNARGITLGATLDANIMDAEDTDYYSFVAPRTGIVKVELRNHSATLIPALTTYSSEMRNIGFGPDVRTPGGDLHYSFEVVENRTYYLQIWSEDRTAGVYSLTVE